MREQEFHAGTSRGRKAGGNGLRLRHIVMELLPERIVGKLGVLRGEEFLRMGVRDDQHPVFVCRHLELRAVGTIDRIRRIETQNAWKAVMSADGGDDADVVLVAGVGGSDEGKPSGEA